MKSSSILLIGAIAEFATAFPGMGGMKRGVNILATASSTTSASSAATSYPAWHPAQAGEVRSPCPGLNALANHDICPRNGKGYTIPLLTSCLAKGFNMGADFSVFVGTAGIGSNPNPELLYFDLDMLDKHGFVIEHDASLSRADASTGNDYSFNETIWDTVLAYYDGMNETSIPAAGKAKFNRVSTERARDPNFSYGPVQFIFSYGETALYLAAMGDPSTGVAPVDYVRSLFEQEKLPYELGWTPPAQPITLQTLGDLVFELNLATGEEVPEGLILGESSLKAALIGVDAITGDVQNAGLYAVAKLTGALADFNNPS